MSAARETLPPRRFHGSFRFEIERIVYAAGVGRMPDGRVMEIWLDAGKVGTSLAALANDAAIMASLLLQYGCPLETIRRALTRNPDGVAAGPVGRVLDEIAEGRI
jgi:ribonucleoside-diphosphate reductase alpha chain